MEAFAFVFCSSKQGFGSALIKCGSGSSLFFNCGSGFLIQIRVPDPDPGFDDLKLKKNL
jgi:hypothetical protein